MTNHTIDALLFEREPGCWVGQYLQYDLGAQAETLENLMYEMQKAIAGHLAICASASTEPFADLDAAPDEYWNMYRAANMNIEAREGATEFRNPRYISVPQTRMRVAA